MVASAVGVILSVTVGYPTATMAARLSVEQLVPRWKHSPPSCVRAAAIAATVTVISATVALFVDDLGVIVQVVGAIGAADLHSCLSALEAALPVKPRLTRVLFRMFFAEVGGFGLFVLPCVIYANLRYPEIAPARRLLTPPGVCGVIGFFVAAVNATMTFINIAAGNEGGVDDGQCGVPPQ